MTANGPGRPGRHVSIVAVADFPIGYATTERILCLAKAFMHAGCQVEIVLLHATRDSPNKQISRSGEVSGISYRYACGGNVRPAGLFATVWDSLAGAVGAAMALYRAPKSDHCRSAVVFYTPNLLKILPALLVARWRGMRVIMEACEVRTARGSVAQGRIRRLASVGDWLTERTAVLWSDGLIPISSRIAGFYRARKYGKPMVLVPALVDLNEMLSSASGGAVPLPEGRGLFVFSGSLKPKDGFPFIVEAMRKLASRHPSALLVVTGKTRAQAEADCPEAMVLGDNVAFTGFLSRPDLYWLYRQAAGLLSCRPRSDFAEYGFPTKLVEYLASGTPVIASRVGDITQFLVSDHNALMFDAGDVDTCVRHMSALLGESGAAFRNRIGAAGRETAQQWFDCRSYSTQLAELAFPVPSEQRPGVA